jgi:hypothetical protein
MALALGRRAMAHSWAPAVTAGTAATDGAAVMAGVAMAGAVDGAGVGDVAVGVGAGVDSAWDSAGVRGGVAAIGRRTGPLIGPTHILRCPTPILAMTLTGLMTTRLPILDLTTIRRGRT